MSYLRLGNRNPVPAPQTPGTVAPKTTLHSGRMSASLVSRQWGHPPVLCPPPGAVCPPRPVSATRGLPLCRRAARSLPGWMAGARGLQTTPAGTCGLSSQVCGARQTRRVLVFAGVFLGEMTRTCLPKHTGRLPSISPPLPGARIHPQAPQDQTPGAGCPLERRCLALVFSRTRR